MKYFFFILIFIIFGNLLVSAQESEKEKKIFPINEFTLSLNRTTVADNNTQDRFGFGIGLYYAFFNQKRCNLITGFEYNRNAQFKKHINEGYFSNKYNVTYTINNVGIPLYFRVNMGQKVIFFIETGVFFDFFNIGREKGYYKTVIPNPMDSTIRSDSGQFNSKMCYKTNFGISGGIGLRIPIKEYEILIKSDYKWGMRNIGGGYEGIHNRYWRITIGFKLN